MNKICIEKVNFANKQDIIEIAYIALQNKIVSPALHELKHKKNPSLSEKLLLQFINKGQFTKTAIESFVNNTVINIALNVALKDIVDNHKNHNVGLYKIYADCKCVGFTGFYITKQQEGKIKEFTLNTFLLPIGGFVGKEIGTRTARDFFNIVSHNLHEFASDCIFISRYVQNNEASKAYQKKLGIDKIAKSIEAKDGIVEIKGDFKDFKKYVIDKNIPSPKL